VRSPLTERFWEAPTLQIKKLWIVSFAPQAARGWMEEGKFREPASEPKGQELSYG